MMIKRILLVEDDLLEYTMMNRALADLGLDKVTLSHAKSGHIALDYLKTDIPNLILLDLSMPQMTGKELLQQLKSIPELRSIPVVVFTTSDKQEDKVQCYSLGAAGYIVKPIDYNKYRDAVKILIDYWDKNESITVNFGGV